MLYKDKNAAINIRQEWIDIRSKSEYEYVYHNPKIKCDSCGDSFNLKDMESEESYDDECGIKNVCPYCHNSDFNFEYESIYDVPKKYLPA